MTNDMCGGLSAVVKNRDNIVGQVAEPVLGRCSARPPKVAVVQPHHASARLDKRTHERRAPTSTRLVGVLEENNRWPVTGFAHPEVKPPDRDHASNFAITIGLHHRDRTVPLAPMITKIAAQLVRGFFMGVADIVPGVSGGTIALLFGIYEKLIDSIRAGSRALADLVRLDFRGFWRRIWKLDFAFLIPLGIGMVAAVASLASVLETQLHDHPEAMAGLFFGLVSASVAIGWDLIKRPSGQHLLLAVGVAIAVFLLLAYQSGPVADPSPVALIASGAFAICAMILPGISGSFILLMIGMYAAVLGAVHEGDIADISLFGLGAIVGLASFSTALGWLLDRHGDRVMAVLVGLMLGSLRVLWPWPNGVGVISENQTEVIDGTGLELPPTFGDVLAPGALAVVGFVVVLAIARVGKRFEA